MSISGRVKGLAIALALLPSALAAEQRGWALGISNDSIGEFRDRWQSSSVQFGLLRGEMPNGTTPERFGALNELRFRSDIITPEDLDDIDPADRRHAGVLALGFHSYAAPGLWEARIGADLVIVGPQTGLYDLQQELHRIVGFTVPQLDGFQIENTARLDFSGEIARPVQLDRLTFRPFAEAQVGSEDILRVGVDFEIGNSPGTPAMRATVTGQRLPFATNGLGWGASFGADVAWVGDSLYLPESLGYKPSDFRTRLRGGLRYVGHKIDVFYGASYLSEEFEGQPEGQIVGTVQLRISF